MPDNIPWQFGLGLAVILWIVWFIIWLRDRRKLRNLTAQLDTRYITNVKAYVVSEDPEANTSVIQWTVTIKRDPKKSGYTSESTKFDKYDFFGPEKPSDDELPPSAIAEVGR